MNHSPTPWTGIGLAPGTFTLRAQDGKMLLRIAELVTVDNLGTCTPNPPVAAMDWADCRVVLNAVNMHAELVTAIRRARSCAEEQRLKSPPPNIGDIHWGRLSDDLTVLLAKAEGE